MGGALREDELRGEGEGERETDRKGDGEREIKK